MGLESITSDFKKSWNPRNYRELCERSFSQSFGYVTFFVLIGLLVWAAFSIPGLLGMHRIRRVHYTTVLGILRKGASLVGNVLWVVCRLPRSGLPRQFTVRFWGAAGG